MAVIGIDASILLHGERAGRRHTRNLLTELLRRSDQDEWRLLFFDRKGHTPGRLSETCGGAVRETVSRMPMRLLAVPWRAAGFPAAEAWLGPVDVFYAPDLYFPPLRRAPVLCTLRGVAYLAIPDLCAPAKVRSLNRAFAHARRHAHHFLAVSESTRQDLLRLTDLPPDRIHVVTHGVDPVFRPRDPEQARLALRRRFGLERPYLLYVGVIGRHKNTVGLIEAFASAGLQRQGIDLVLAGPFESKTGEERSWAARAGLEAGVHFTGPLVQEDETLAALYSAALALVHPSFYEGWCATPLEAMACGTAVVAADIPSVREVVQDAAILVPPDDIDAWKQAMIRVAGDESLRSALIAQGLWHVQAHTWQRSAERLRQVLTHVMEAGR